MIPLPLLCAVAPGRGRRRVLDRLARVEERLAEANATVFSLIAERNQLETVARHHQSVAIQRAHIIDDLSDQLVTAEMRIRELEAQREAGWAKRANEDTLSVPAPADDPQSAWFDGGKTAEIDVRPLWDAIPQPAPAGPVVRITATRYRDPATNPAA